MSDIESTLPERPGDRTHHGECWRDHPACAQAAVERLTEMCDTKANRIERDAVLIERLTDQVQRLTDERTSAYVRFTNALVAVLRTKTDPRLIDAILDDMREELADA